MSMICTKIEFSNSQSAITGITVFPDEELFQTEGNTKTAKLSLMIMFSLSFFLMYTFPHQYMAIMITNQKTK